MITKFGSVSVQYALKKWGDGIIKEVKKVVTETAYIIQAEAQAQAPTDSGYLRESIEVEIMNGGLSAVVTVGAEYAIYIEYGTGIYAVKGNGRKDPWVYYSEKHGEFRFTRGMKAQPFWMPAIEKGRRHFKAGMRALG